MNPHLLLSQNIISTRAQTPSSHFIALVKLKSPSLMEAGTLENGKAVIDAKLLEQINKEHTEAIAQMQALGDVQVIYQYKMVLNAVTVLAPMELESKIRALGVVASFENSGNFARPQTFDLTSQTAATPAFSEKNSSKFIGAEALNNAGIRGQGMKVGVIDSGIDFTHAMFKGAGTEEAFKAVNPSEPNTGFPNEKVVGGIDLVGTQYDAGSDDFQLQIPKPDMNPIDEGGHGTHVAGTVAGIGDGVNTYNGMAPDAVLHSIKVFGADGSTSTAVVVAALEYAADPNKDGNTEDQLDVVNLSLGSGYGSPQILYSEAVKNLVRGGTVVVASAGNSGHKDYIVGAPSTANEALSVAASIDNADHLWKFRASEITLGSEKLVVEAIEAATTKAIAESDVTGKLVHIGLAASDLTEEQINAVRGNVALIDRGQVTFNEKITRAVAAGAIGVVVANNQQGAPIKMGTDTDFPIPAIMVTKSDGDKIKAALTAGQQATIVFKTDTKIEKPELIDTLTDFTSKGPRSVDGWIKPEIAAPGENVISAAMGKGAKAVQMSGTSMAGPHMAGVMALLKQKHPTLSALELKSVAMGTTKTMSSPEGRYPISMQGAGRVQADKAANSKIVVMEASLSLGLVGLESKKSIRRQLTVKNISDEKQTLQLSFEGSEFVTMSAPETIEIEARTSAQVTISLTLNATQMTETLVREMDGWVKLSQNSEEVYRVPVLAVAHKLSNLKAQSLTVQSASEEDASGAAAELKIENRNANSGQVLLFNLIGEDERKPRASNITSTSCDLQNAGYRIISREGENGEQEEFLQIGIKLYKPMTTWLQCDVSLMIDADGDGQAEQELLGANTRSIPGATAEMYATVLIDATKARDIRSRFEAAKAAAGNDQEKLKQAYQILNYGPTLLEMQNYRAVNNSSVSVMEISTKNLALTAEGHLAFKIIVTHNEANSVQTDDRLQTTQATDMRISLRKQDQSFVDLPDTIEVSGQGSGEIPLTKGDGREKLLVLFPANRFSESDLHNDSQSVILSPTYLTP